MLIEDTKGNIFGGVDNCLRDLLNEGSTNLDAFQIQSLSYLFQLREDGSFLKFKLKEEIIKSDNFKDQFKNVDQKKKKSFVKFGNSDLLVSENADESKNSCSSKLDWYEIDSHFIPRDVND